MLFIYLFIYSAKLWAEKVGRLCTMEDVGFLKYKFLCRDHFLLTDFVKPEGICQNRLAVPHGLDWASHSILQPSLPLLPILSNPQPSAVRSYVAVILTVLSNQITCVVGNKVALPSTG